MKGYYIATVGVLTYCTHHAIQGSFTVDHVPLSVSTQRCWEYHHRQVHCGQKLCLASFVPSGHHVAREGSLPNLAMFVSWANCELLNALLRLWTDITSIPALHMNITVHGRRHNLMYSCSCHESAWQQHFYSRGRKVMDVFLLAIIYFLFWGSWRRHEVWSRTHRPPFPQSSQCWGPSLPTKVSIWSEW